MNKTIETRGADKLRTHTSAKSTLGAAGSLVAASGVLLLLLFSTGCAFSLFYVEVRVEPVLMASAPSEATIEPTGIPPEIIKEFLTLYPFKKARIEAIKANKAIGVPVRYVKRWGILKITSNPKQRGDHEIKAAD